MKTIHVLLIILVLSSCQRNKIERTIKQITSHQVVIPEKLAVSFNRSVTEISAEAFEGQMLYVIYVDSASCASCKIANLEVYMPLFLLSQSTKRFQLMILFYTPSKKPELMMGDASRKGYPFPIYFDTDNVFLASNPLIPADNKYHGFLLDEKHIPILVGDPVSSSYISLVKEAL